MRRATVILAFIISAQVAVSQEVHFKATEVRVQVRNCGDDPLGFEAYSYTVPIFYKRGQRFVFWDDQTLTLNNGLRLWQRLGERATVIYKGVRK